MADEKLIFPIGFDLEEGVKEASKEWKNTYQKQLQKAIDDKPLKVKIDFESKGIDTKEFKQWMVLAREAEKVERERIKNAREWQKVADQQAMAETRRANATNESNARIERQNRKAEASERRKRDAVERTNEAYKRQGGYLQRLFQRMVAYVSVAQAFSFVRNVRDVTAEFELQRVALGSIIGDLNEANAMFEQIKAAAVKSPFQIKELVTYTKQLAAYKIETDELFETTQRLADISAGLGVGMERLILAYGQIRATGYLRASEVRQLTEAGIPIIEELAKKMSQLRGETVSAAEVMGLISERAISFGMVKEVFDDMTSAGGMFYKMQEKQAETLAGQWSNLQDAISIMYEEIGNTEGVNNSIKGTIGLVKSLAENWRDVWSVVQSLSVAMGVYYVAMKNTAVASKALSIAEATRLSTLKATTIYMPKFLASTKLAITLTRAYRVAVIKSATATGLLSKAFWGLTKAMLSNPYTAVLAALAGITFAIVKFATKTKTTQERIDDLNKSVASLTDLKDDVKPLVDELDALSQKANKTADEQKRLKQVTQELADKYPSTISAVREYGKEVDITAGKVRELYEAELKAKTVGLRAELVEDERALNDLRKRYDNIIKTINKGTYTTSIATQGGKPVIYEKSYTQEELAQFWQEAKKVEEEMRPLEQSIRDAKVALGDIPPEATRAIEAFGSWKQTIKDFKTGLKNDLGEDIKLFDDDIINQFTSLNDALDSVAEQYNKNDEAIKRYTQTLASKKLTQAERKDIEDKKTRATAFRDTASAILDYYNARSLLNKKKGGNEGESELSILQKELQLHEKIYAKYKEYRKYMSDEQAQAKVEDYFGDTIKSLMFEPKYDSQGFKQVLKQYQDYARTLPESEKVVLDIGFKVEDINWQDTKTELEDSLKRLSDQLSRTKTAKDFFDRMLGMTGDRELSATLTMSVYGDDADVMGGLLAQQTANAFKKKYKDIDFSDVAISDKGIFDWETILMEGTEQFDKFGEQGWLDFLKDVQAAQDASAKRLETLMNELEKTKTYSEKLVDIYTNTQERLNAIDQEVSDETTRKRLKEQAKELQTKEMQKLQYESFKDSPMYVAMFENLDATSTAMLTNMRNHIVKLQSEWQKLSPTQLKELQSRINEIDKQLATRNPFKGIVDGIKEMNALGNREQDEQSLLDATKKKLQAEKEYAQAVADGKGEAEIQRLASALQKCVDNEKKAAEQMTKWDNATQKVMQGMQNLQQITQLVQTTTTAVNDIVEAFGGWGDAADEEFWNTIINGINGLMSGVQSLGTGIVLSLINPMLGIPSIISGIGSIVPSIGNLIYAGRIKRANEEIERQQELLDSLAYSYERLGKAQEKAFGSEYISNYQQRMENLQAQQEAYLKQADAERSKGKKADEDKIKEYEEQARATADAIKDMQSELSEYFLGTDLTSAARDFANAWIEAYKEFGSTTDAMKEKFQDMIQNMVVESFAAKVMQTALQPIFDEIDKMSEDGALDMSEASKIADMTKVAVGNIDVGMTNLMDALSQAGISVRGMGSDMTGISRDIATASEESILGLAAGINTQNFYISQVPTKLDTIIGLLRGDGAMPQGSAITLQDVMIAQNQFLSHLPTIAQHTAETVAECKQIVAETRRTADALDRVIKPRGTQSTYTINATLN